MDSEWNVREPYAAPQGEGMPNSGINALQRGVDVDKKFKDTGILRGSSTCVSRERGGRRGRGHRATTISTANIISLVESSELLRTTTTTTQLLSETTQIHV
ncbi:hypothetical protein PM082_021212 [Marasmius tenuissimus]|nr:hypothetical protein PM082_021212 [Marasmius tenuissimus]